MKSFTQRWREASDEAEDQPMEDTPTDPKEAPVIAHTDYKAIASGLQRVNAALESALAAQTERADRLQAEVEEARREASTLATSIWRSEYQKDAPNWSLCDSIAGIISQIDNMYAGIRGQRDQLKMEVNGLQVLTEAEKTMRMRVELAHEADTGLLTAELDAVRKANAELQIELQHCPTCAKTKAKCAELEKLIQDAPHEEDCDLFADWPRRTRVCTCWKSRLTPTQQASAWRPIEAAPKDAIIQGWSQRSGWYPQMRWSVPYRQWQVRSGGEWLYTFPEHVTHWQPLPAPPEEKRP